jgi:DNA-binding MarR family transcriptional regulator
VEFIVSNGKDRSVTLRDAPTRERLLPWMNFLRGHAMIMRELSAELLHEHGLSINDYEVLLYLSNAPEQRMRRVDLAASVLVTASGITRILQSLEREGYVESRTCPDDGRVSWACLTDAGLEKVRAARATHLDGVRRLFVDRFSEDELAALGELLLRLPGNAD